MENFGSRINIQDPQNTAYINRVHKYLVVPYYCTLLVQNTVLNLTNSANHGCRLQIFCTYNTEIIFLLKGKATGESLLVFICRICAVPDFMYKLACKYHCTVLNKSGIHMVYSIQCSGF
jgi:hypothetical protein